LRTRSGARGAGRRSACGGRSGDRRRSVSAPCRPVVGAGPGRRTVAADPVGRPTPDALQGRRIAAPEKVRPAGEPPVLSGRTGEPPAPV